MEGVAGIVNQWKVNAQRHRKGRPDRELSHDDASGALALRFCVSTCVVARMIIDPHPRQPHFRFATAQLLRPSGKSGPGISFMSLRSTLPVVETAFIAATTSVRLRGGDLVAMSAMPLAAARSSSCGGGRVGRRFHDGITSKLGHEGHRPGSRSAEHVRC
jgi:hypothetical protein